MRSADWAVWIFAQLQFAELHSQCIDQQQAANEWFTLAEDQLDDLRCLNHPKQPGQNTEHTALCAGGNKSWWWRLRIKAAVARALFGGKDTGLPFKAEDRGVRIGFAAEHAGVIDQVARGEVVGAIGNDVVVLDNLKCVGAGEHRLMLHNLQIRIQRL